MFYLLSIIFKFKNFLYDLLSLLFDSYSLYYCFFKTIYCYLVKNMILYKFILNVFVEVNSHIVRKVTVLLRSYTLVCIHRRFARWNGFISMKWDSHKQTLQFQMLPEMLFLGNRGPLEFPERKFVAERGNYLKLPLSFICGIPPLDPGHHLYYKISIYLNSWLKKNRIK